MCDFAPGDRVICVALVPDIETSSSKDDLIVGAEYTVMAVQPGESFDDGVPGILLQETDAGFNHKGELWWSADQFRRVPRITETFRAKLLAPVDLNPQHKEPAR